MIRQSGRFEYDENLDAFYDYEKYGTERMNEEDRMFTDRGYVAYKGFFSMEEVLSGSQSSHMVMGGAFTMIIQAELKCKQTGCEADPCAVAVWILRNTVRTAWGNDCCGKKESSACCAA